MLAWLPVLVCLGQAINFNIWMHLTLLKLCMPYLTAGTRCRTEPGNFPLLTSSLHSHITLNQGAFYYPQ